MYYNSVFACSALCVYIYEIYVCVSLLVIFLLLLPLILSVDDFCGVDDDERRSKLGGYIRAKSNTYIPTK